MSNKVLPILITALAASAITYGLSTQMTTQNQNPVAKIASPPAQALVQDNSSEQQVIQLYKQNSGSVVNVTTRSFQYNYHMELVPRQGAGSGFVIDNEGHVVTNAHVVEGAQKFFVAFGNMEESFPAKLIGIDKRNDLAVLKAEAPQELLKAVRLGNSSQLEVGQTAIAIGNPFGLGQTITTGVISSLNRSIKTENGHQMEGLMQTDASINRGNSGGPLFNSSGEVIGVNTAIYSPSGGSVGIGFAIPINIVKRLVPELIEFGAVRYPVLGVQILSLSPRLARLLKLPVNKGLLVARVVPQSSAAQAGIQGGNRRIYIGNYELIVGGDILLAIDGQQLTKDSDLVDYLQSQKKVGDTVQLTLLKRGRGKPINVDVPLLSARAQ